MSGQSAFFTRPKRVSARLDMAPLIDVVFLLLIFFMLTSSFLQPSIPLALPKAATKTDEPPPAPVFVSVDTAGTVYLNQEPVNREGFAEALRVLLAGRDDRTVNFRGDRAMPYEIFVALMDEARQAGAVQFNIVHEAKD
jgi:biopolymer transport protein ExbD